VLSKIFEYYHGSPPQQPTRGMVQSLLDLYPPPTEVGETIPSNTPHAVSVTLPTWDANVAYEEGKDWVHSKLRSGYPRYQQSLSLSNADS
jgi:hypothetical protein